MEKEKIVMIERTIHFHELHVDFKEDYAPVNAINNEQFTGFFSLIANLAQTKDDLRYQRIGDSLIFVQDVLFDKKQPIITGKIRSVRMDVFPEIIDIKTDIAKGIEAKETEGIVETTHFIINYSKKIKRIALEHNQAGAKIADFIRYCEIVGMNKGALNTFDYIPIAASNELPKYKKRIANISGFVFKVHRDNIPAVAKLDGKVHTAIKQLKQHFSSEYIGITLTFDYKNAKVQDIHDSVNNIINTLIKEPKAGLKIEKIEARAQDAANNFKMYTFDLLIDKLESTIKVQKKQKFRTIVSVDIFDKMQTEAKEKFKNL